MAKSNSVYTESAARGGKIMVGHAPDREPDTGMNKSQAVKGKDMKDTGLSHSISSGSVKHY